MSLVTCRSLRAIYRLQRGPIPARLRLVYDHLLATLEAGERWLARPSAVLQAVANFDVLSQIRLRITRIISSLPS
jgi:hypothetical protein